MTAYYEAKHKAGYDVLVDQEHPVRSDRCIGTRCRMHQPKHRAVSLSDCVNWLSNERGDCGGRVERVNGVLICETCRNR